MKTYISIVLMAFITTLAIAQNNPRTGFIITNNGDTIRGNIDFRTDEKMSKQCIFQENGKTEFTTYTPGTIEAFKFDNNGKYFVTRRLNVTGSPELYFAEYIVHGKMNLYCVENNSNQYYFFEREDGEMAILTNKSVDQTSALATQEARDNRKEQQAQYGKVRLLLQDSWAAAKQLDGKNMSVGKFIDVVRTYHNDVCTDGSSCIVYEYDEKANTKTKCHFKAFAGYAYYPTDKGDYHHYTEENYPGNTFEIGVGIELEMDRLIKYFSTEIGIAFNSKYKSSHEIFDLNYIGAPILSTYEKKIFTLSAGGVKRFGNGKIQPLIRGGFSIIVNYGIKESMYRNRPSYPVVDKGIGWDTNYPFGGYLGAGVQFRIGKQAVRLHGDWYKSSLNSTKWGVTAEFVL